MFGYSDLVVDPRNIVLMRDAGCPITCDITHALQQPAAKPLEVCMTLHTLCTVLGELTFQLVNLGSIQASKFLQTCTDLLADPMQ